MVTLDGYFEGPGKGQIDWHNVDAEFNTFAMDQLNATGMLLFGRVTYEGMASYWPTPSAIANDPEIARTMNAIPRLFSQGRWTRPTGAIRDSSKKTPLRSWQSSSRNLEKRLASSAAPTSPRPSLPTPLS